MIGTRKKKTSILVDEEFINHLKELQYQNYCTLQTLFESYLFSLKPEFWKGIIAELTNVIGKCDEIDFQKDEMAVAYAIWHFLDRYHRFQIMLQTLIDKGCLIYKECRYDVLDIGTGPSQTLFALSDYFSELNCIDGSANIFLKSEYVERSEGFRNFLHRFVEFAMMKEKRYLVPFHFAKSTDAFNIPFNETVPSWYKRSRDIKIKSRYDIVVFNNFLTNPDFMNTFTEQLKTICRFIRNNGLLIVIGARNQLPKYAEVYSIIQSIVLRRFNHRKFFGYWSKIVDREYDYKYDDQFGEELRKHYEHIVSFLKMTPLEGNGEECLWDLVSETDRDLFARRMGKEDNNLGIKWKMVVYQKHSFFKGKVQFTRDYTG